MTFKAAAAVVLTMAIASPAMATEGYFQNGSGARQKALAGAGVADSKDATAVSLNPAGLVHSGNEVEASASLFSPWHAVIDAVRRDAQTLWPKLSITEQRSIVRHLRTFWDVHRFRIAPQVAAVLKRKIVNGSLEVFPAHLDGIAVQDDSISLTLSDRRRGSRASREVGAFVLASGPGHRSVTETNPAFRTLARDGLIKADGLGLGIACDRSGRALDKDGRAVSRLFVAGPLARATFGELMGLPQVSVYANAIASDVLNVISTGIR